MQTLHTIKSMSNIKTLHMTNKSAIPKKEKNDFLTLYMFEKEKTRLCAEEKKLVQRLDYIRGRLNEISRFYKQSGEELQRQENEENDIDNENSEPRYKTMLIDY